MTDNHELLPSGFASWLAEQLRVSNSKFSKLADGDITFSNIRRPGAGQSNDTVLFTVEFIDGEHAPYDLVLRRQPTGRQIFLAPDVTKEGRILQGLYADAHVPVPQVIAIESRPDVPAQLGGLPFFVMEQIPGRVPLARPSIHLVGWMTELDPIQQRHMWDSALNALVAVHKVDWQKHLSFLLEGHDSGAPTANAVASHVEKLATWYRWTCQGREYPITDAALEYLEANIPSVETGDLTLAWGDGRVGNMIFNDKNEVAACVDWEVATICTPELDLAHWLFFDEFTTTGSGVERRPGWPDRNTTISEYESRSGRALTNLDYFELMEEFFIAVTIIRQSDFRVEAGLSKPDSRMGHDNAVTQMIARRLGLPVPEQDPDYLAHRGAKPIK